MDEQTISTDEEIRIREERRLNGLFSLQGKKNDRKRERKRKKRGQRNMERAETEKSSNR